MACLSCRYLILATEKKIFSGPCAVRPTFPPPPGLSIDPPTNHLINTI